jgi:Undecaprenyl-phosphate galactose phosphotransferase WbaP
VRGIPPGRNHSPEDRRLLSRQLRERFASLGSTSAERVPMSSKSIASADESALIDETSQSSSPTQTSEPQAATEATHRLDARHAVAVDRATPAPAEIGGTRSGMRTVLCYVMADALSIVLVVWGVRLLLLATGLEGAISYPDVRLALGFTAAAMIVNWYQWLYSTLSLKPAAELRQIWFSALGMAAFFALLLVMDLPKSSLVTWLAISSLVMAVVVPLLRAGCRLAFGRSKWWGRRILLVGCGERSANMYRALKKNAIFGLRPVGFVEDFDELSEETDAEGYLGPIAELTDRVQEYNVSLGMVVSNGMGPRSEMAKLVSRPSTGITDWLLVSDCTSLPCLWTAAREVAGMPALGVANRLQSGWRRVAKRGLDLVIVLAFAPLWLPLIGLLALLVRLSSPGKAFYSQTRLGLDGRTFQCWKLRSMVQNADQVLRDYLASNPDLQAEWDRDHKLKNDPRITWIGKFIRKTSLDELPQVWNILRGDMSLVGPRPIVSAEIVKYGDVYEQYRLVVPGITGLWQVNGRNNTTYAERLALDEYYVRNWSVWLDVYIMLCTVKVVILREGAY